MGLDLSIYAKLKNRNSGKETCIELAYWRKAYGIRDMLVEVAEKYRNNDPENLDDVDIFCRTIAITEIIDRFLEEIPNLSSNLWTDSIWDAADTRKQTLIQLNNLLNFNDWLCGDCDSKTLLEDLSEIREVNYIEARNCYEVSLEILNSY